MTPPSPDDKPKAALNVDRLSVNKEPSKRIVQQMGDTARITLDNSEEKITEEKPVKPNNDLFAVAEVTTFIAEDIKGKIGNLPSRLEEAAAVGQQPEPLQPHFEIFQFDHLMEEDMFFVESILREHGTLSPGQILTLGFRPDIESYETKRLRLREVITNLDSILVDEKGQSMVKKTGMGPARLYTLGEREEPSRVIINAKAVVVPNRVIDKTATTPQDKKDPIGDDAAFVESLLRAYGPLMPREVFYLGFKADLPLGARQSAFTRAIKRLERDRLDEGSPNIVEQTGNTANRRYSLKDIEPSYILTATHEAISTVVERNQKSVITMAEIRREVYKGALTDQQYRTLLSALKADTRLTYLGNKEYHVHGRDLQNQSWISDSEIEAVIMRALDRADKMKQLFLSLRSVVIAEAKEGLYLTTDEQKRLFALFFQSPRVVGRNGSVMKLRRNYPDDEESLENLKPSNPESA